MTTHAMTSSAMKTITLTQGFVHCTPHLFCLPPSSNSTRSLTPLAHPHLGDRVHGQPSAESLCVLAPIQRYFVILLGRKPTLQEGYFTGVGHSYCNKEDLSLSRMKTRGGFSHLMVDLRVGSASRFGLRWSIPRKENRTLAISLFPLSHSFGYMPTRCLTLCGRLLNRVVLRFSCHQEERVLLTGSAFSVLDSVHISRYITSSTCIIVYSVKSWPLHTRSA